MRNGNTSLGIYIIPEVVTQSLLFESPSRPESISFIYGPLPGKIQRNLGDRAVNRKKSRRV